MLELVAAYGNYFFHNRPSEVMKSKRTIYRELAIRFSICYGQLLYFLFTNAQIIFTIAITKHNIINSISIMLECPNSKYIPFDLK